MPDRAAKRKRMQERRQQRDASAKSSAQEPQPQTPAHLTGRETQPVSPTPALQVIRIELAQDPVKPFLANILSSNVGLIIGIVVTAVGIVFLLYLIQIGLLQSFANVPTTVVTPTPTLAPAITPSPSITSIAGPSAQFVGAPRVECNPSSGPPYIEFRFQAGDLPVGFRLRAFARSRGNSRYYPAKTVIEYVGGQYVAKVYSSPADTYSAHVFLVDTNAERDVTTYIADRERDKDWGLGMELPPGARGLIDMDDIPGCRAPRPTPSPKPVTTGRPTRSN